jgi:PIN domain nuclease of toxin-antitoxin system
VSRLLLDTHILLWSLFHPERLSVEASDAISDADNEVFFSAASIWEIAIKAALGRADFAHDPVTIVAMAQATGFPEIPVRSTAASLVVRLPLHHRDPFDRLLVAQAMAEGLILCTADPFVEQYSQHAQLLRAV